MTRSPIRWWRTDLGEASVARMQDALRNRTINQGPLCQELEQQLAHELDVPFVALTTSGSTALLLSLLACNLKPGDEVIVPALTFIATAHAPFLLGAKVRLVDVRRDKPIIDVAQIEAAITERTRAIVPVHFNGASCDMAKINNLATRHSLSVVEDAAQAFCSRNMQGCLGTQSDVGAFSMSMTKLITTGEGGFVATRNETIFRRILRLRNHGVTRLGENVFDRFGFNFRFNDLLAAVALAQVDRLGRTVEKLRRVHEFYRARLQGLSYMRVLGANLERGELPLWSEALCAERDRVVTLLNEGGIEAKAFHPCLADSKHLDSLGEFPFARYYANHGMILPSGPDRTDEELERTVDALKALESEIQTPLEPRG